MDITKEQNLINYIKSKYPKIIFNPIKLNGNINTSKSLGFIISDDKIIIGYINDKGNLCKLVDPINLNDLSNEKFTEIINNLPIVKGVNKDVLLNLLKSKKDDSFGELGLYNTMKNKYDVLIEDNEKNIILIKKEYTSKIEDIKKEYEDEINELKINIKDLNTQKESCRDKLLNEKEQIISGIKNFKKEVSEYITNILENQNMTDNELNDMYIKLLKEKTDVENAMTLLSENEKSNLKKLYDNQDIISDFSGKLQTKENDIIRLNETIREIQEELIKVENKFNEQELENIVLAKFKKNCIELILNDKESIIDKIKDYNGKWLDWINSNNINVETQKEKLKDDLEIIFTNLKKVVNSKNDYIEKLDLSLKEKENLINKLNNNISDIKYEVNKSLQDQLIQLSIKNEELQMVHNKDSDIIRNNTVKMEELTKQLEYAKSLLDKNANIIIPKEIDYNSCYATLQKFTNINNTFYRKKDVILIIDNIINNESNINAFNNLNDQMKIKIKDKFESVKVEINKHIDFLNLNKYIESPTIKLFKSKSTIKNVPSEFCEELNNISIYWDNNIGIFREQDRILTNIYEDLSGAVRVYIKIKPLIGIEQKENTVYIESQTKKVTVDCSKIANVNKKQTYGEFYGVFDDTFTNKDVYTGIQGSGDLSELEIDITKIEESADTVSPGLYSTFKQVEDGYSIVLFGYGLSGSGKCLGRNTPILMYDGTIKMVQDVVDGDLVMGDDSRARRVFGVTRGRDTMYKIKNIKGESYIVNSEHILSLKYVGRKQLKDREDIHSYQVIWFNKEKIDFDSIIFNYKNKNKSEVFIQAQQLYNDVQDDLYVDIPVQKYLSLSKHFKEFLVGYKVSVEFPHRDLEIDPYTIGYWLADGTSNIDAIISQESLKKLNLINNKHIPMIYKCNSREQQLKLLAGILDVDGSYNKEKRTFKFRQSLEHEQFIDDIIYLCQSLGFACYKNKKQTTWIISITGAGTEQIPILSFIKQIKQIKQITQTTDVLISGITIEELPEDDYYGFAVDCNHRFLLGNFTVTHNTYSLLGEKNTPGLLHYGLANLNGMKNIKLKYLFEQYIDKFVPTINKIRGKIINLVREVPQLRKYSKDETQEFAEYLSDKINVNNLHINDINTLTNILEQYRKKHFRIKATPNNPVSSRSHLYMVFEITFENNKTGYITIVDTAGRESPLDIYNMFIDTKSVNLTTLLGPTGGADIVGRHLNPEYKAYKPNDVYEILKEGFYINETLNHLIYFFNKKNYKNTKIVTQSSLDKYNNNRYYVNPQLEEDSIDPINNCLMIPILKFLDVISNRNKSDLDYTPTKFITLACVRKDASFCSQIFSTLEFSEKINSS